MGASLTPKSNSKVPVALAEINVTPLVDVMLVLLIVFMISAPLLQQGLQVNLPKADADNLNEVPDQVELTVTKSKRILFNGEKIKRGTLVDKLGAMATVKPDIQVYVRADQAVPYGFIAQVISAVKKAKVTSVGLVTEPGRSKDSP